MTAKRFAPRRRLGRLDVLACASALGLCLLGVGNAVAQPTVRIDLQQLDPASYRALDGLTLEAKLFTRLVESGFAVVSARPGTPAPELVVAIEALPTEIGIEARHGDVRRRRSVPREGSLAELHLEIVHKVVELARSLHAESIAGAAPPSTTPTAGVPPPAPRPRSRGELRVGLDALWRVGGVDPLVRLGARFSLWRVLSFYLETGWGPASRPGIEILEWQLQAGPGVRLELTARLRLEGAILAGLLLHQFALAQQSVAEASGVRVDFLGTLPITLSFAPIRPLSLSLRVAPGFASTSRSHLLDGQTLWTRSALRIETGASIAWCW